MKIIVKRDEHRIVPILWLGDEHRMDYDIILSEPGASVEVWGLMIGKGSQNCTLEVTITHKAPYTTAKAHVKSALYDQSKTHVNGMLKVDGGAVGSDTWFAAHIMLLSNQATGEAIPGLEIVENDIVAGHATTIGQVDELQLFYLMSRGFDRQAAKKIIVNGFLQDAINNLPKDLQREALKAIES